MRLRIIFYANKDLVLPLHYNHMIQKNIYDLLDFDYSSFYMIKVLNMITGVLNYLPFQNLLLKIRILKRIK
ncbi:hypothetical protein [Caloramator sp. Dgby_cultured_2]|uniref:hypothetical protein n=1 Tax=Caloramator sp. Dgby_cultured_2 TaxID=3029174 RepID=UPI00237E3EC9|nr:hypothetical protein [Caloramator sp. Dgby_cultured_2]WDU83346.1 hypothetical protein PWK10_01060 [Caloramator sp. Dgby_cultured_2]